MTGQQEQTQLSNTGSDWTIRTSAYHFQHRMSGQRRTSLALIACSGNIRHWPGVILVKKVGKLFFQLPRHSSIQHLNMKMASPRQRRHLTTDSFSRLSLAWPVRWGKARHPSRPTFASSPGISEFDMSCPALRRKLHRLSSSRLGKLSSSCVAEVKR